MAQSVSLWGATYSNVPALDVPKDGGGTARFTDVTSTTAIASDVAQGKKFFLADGTESTGTATGDVPTIESLNVTPSTSQQTFNSSSVDGYKPVVVDAMPSGTAGTPTATKGSVSNHSVSVTPSVTNTTGYITGSTKTGTAVTVSASELVSGSETKTANGTYDVTNLAELVVNVSGGGGASNVVTGTFTGTTTGAAMDVTLNYSGSGYPTSIQIYPKGGIYGNSAYRELIKRYAVGTFFGYKYDATTIPDYSSSSDINMMTVNVTYKNSTTDATAYNDGSSYRVRTFRNVNATATSTNVALFKSATKLCVFIQASSYGFAANIEYVYTITYSS